MDSPLDFLESTSRLDFITIDFAVPISGVAAVATNLLGPVLVLLGVATGWSEAVSSRVSSIKLEIFSSFENSEKSQELSITTLFD